MAYEWTDWAQDADIRDSQGKGILIVLALGAGTGYCWHSVANIARRSGCSEKTVQRHLAALELSGYISAFMRFDRYGQADGVGYRLNSEFTDYDADIAECLGCSSYEPYSLQPKPRKPRQIVQDKDKLSSGEDSLSEKKTECLNSGQIVQDKDNLSNPYNIDRTISNHKEPKVTISKTSKVLDAEGKPSKQKARASPKPLEIFKIAQSAWNENCGELSKVNKPNDWRKRRVLALYREHIKFGNYETDEARLEGFANAMADATKQVVLEGYYLTNNHGFDSLIRSSRVDTYSEKWRTGQSKRKAQSVNRQDLFS